MLDSLRNFINNNARVMTALAAVFLILLTVWLFTRGGPGQAESTTTDVWFYDTVTKELFVAKADRVSPIASPAGNEAVRAMYYSCGTCAEGERFLGYYEKFGDEAKKFLEENPSSRYFGGASAKGRLLSTDAVTWVEAASDEGLAILDAPHKKCKTLRVCNPGDDTPSGSTTPR